MSKAPLRLLAHDAEDLEVFSAFLQDAILRVGDIAYMPKSRRFAAVLNRYCWEGDLPTHKASVGGMRPNESTETLKEDGGGGEHSCLRTRAGLHFESVLRVRALNLRQSEPDAVVELLAIRFVPGEDGAGTVDLLLAGGGAIRLDVECLDATLADLAEPWPAKTRPIHEVETGS
jgi:hypothetical protein